jgi:hypothetical protein
LAYTLHYRSYYFIKTGEVSEFESYRYLAHLIPLYALLAGAGVNYCWKILKKVAGLSGYKQKALVTTVAGLVGVFAALQTVTVRERFVEIEEDARLRSVRSVLSFAQKQGQLIALVVEDVLLFQILDDSLFLIDLQVLRDGKGQADALEIGKQRAVYLVKKPHFDSAIFQERSSSEVEFLATRHMEHIFADPEGRFTIYRLR